MIVKLPCIRIVEEDWSFPDIAAKTHFDHELLAAFSGVILESAKMKNYENATIRFWFRNDPQVRICTATLNTNEHVWNAEFDYADIPLDDDPDYDIRFGVNMADLDMALLAIGERVMGMWS